MATDWTLQKPTGKFAKRKGMADQLDDVAGMGEEDRTRQLGPSLAHDKPKTDAEWIEEDWQDPRDVRVSVITQQKYKQEATKKLSTMGINTKPLPFAFATPISEGSSILSGSRPPPGIPARHADLIVRQDLTTLAVEEEVPAHLRSVIMTGADPSRSHEIPEYLKGVVEYGPAP